MEKKETLDGNDVTEHQNKRNKRLQSFYRFLEEVEIDEQTKTSQDLPNVIELQQKLKENEHAKQSVIRKYEESIAVLKARHKELEIVVGKHLATIDQLMEDKMKLTTRVDELLGQFEAREKRYESTFKAMSERHVEEIRKAKEMALAGERNRREEFINAERKKIRESTINSIHQELLDMEKRSAHALEELQSAHKAEVQRLKELGEEKIKIELEKQKKEIVRQHNILLEAQLAGCSRQHEESLEEERRVFIAQRQGWLDTIEATKSDCKKRIQECSMQLEQARDKFMKENIELANSLEMEYQRKVEEMSKLRNAEIEIARKDAHEQMTRIIAAKEIDIKRRVVQERDSEIEKIIQQFAEEVEAVRNTNILNIETLKKEHKLEVDDLQTQQTNCYSLLQEASLEREETERQLSKIQKQIELYNEEKSQLTAMNASLKEKLNELDRQHGDDVEALRSRVKQTIKQKDDKMEEMKAEIKVLQEKLKELSIAIAVTN